MKVQVQFLISAILLLLFPLFFNVAFAGDHGSVSDDVKQDGWEPLNVTEHVIDLAKYAVNEKNKMGDYPYLYFVKVISPGRKKVYQQNNIMSRSIILAEVDEILVGYYYRFVIYAYYGQMDPRPYVAVVYESLSGEDRALMQFVEVPSSAL